MQTYTRGVSDRFNLSKTRIKTLDEINAEKEALIRKAKEKQDRERKLVLDNIYLLRIKEANPDSNIVIPDYIQNLIDAYLRRNMV